jgi:hypothetical protein
MAQRPIFIPANESFWPPVVTPVSVEFRWHAGLAVSQKQKSIRELHASGSRLGALLEISSKSESLLGQQLSAFNLMYRLADGRRRSVEVVFQASKRFERGGPFPELLECDAREARAVVRRPEHGRLTGFVLEDMEWPLVPRTAFYDFVYLSALVAAGDVGEQLMAYNGFTDIEFNPAKSLNCQARSCAMYCALRRAGHLDQVMASPNAFLAAAGVMYSKHEGAGQQGSLELS